MKIGFLDTDKINGVGRKKVKQFSAPGSKTSSITLKTPKRVREKRKQEAWKDSQEEGAAVRGKRKKI